MTRSQRRSALLICTFALAAGLAACGGSVKPSTTSASSTSSASVVTLRTSSQTSSGAAATSSGAATTSSGAAAASSGGSSSATTTSTTASSSTPTSPTLTKVDNYCQAAGAAIGGLSAPKFQPTQVTQSTLPQVAAYVGQVVPLAEDEERDLRAVVGSDPKSKYIATVEALATAVGDESTALTAAKAGSVAGFKSAYNSYLRDSTTFERDATAAGFTGC